MKIRDRRFRCDLCGRYSDIGVTEHKPQAKRASVVCKGCIWQAGRMIQEHLDAHDDELEGFEGEGDEVGDGNDEGDPKADEKAETVVAEDPATQDEPAAENAETG